MCFELNILYTLFVGFSLIWCCCSTGPDRIECIWCIDSIAPEELKLTISGVTNSICTACELWNSVFYIPFEINCYFINIHAGIDRRECGDNCNWELLTGLDICPAEHPFSGAEDSHITVFYGDKSDAGIVGHPGAGDDSAEATCITDQYYHTIRFHSRIQAVGVGSLDTTFYRCMPTAEDDCLEPHDESDYTRVETDTTNHCNWSSISFTIEESV